MTSRLKHIDRSPLGRVLSLREKVLLAPHIEIHELDVGEVWCAQDEPSKGALWVLQGALSVERDGQHTTVSAPEGLGYLGVLTPSLSPVEIRAQETSQILLLSHVAFDQFRQRAPKLGARLSGLLWQWSSPVLLRVKDVLVSMA